ncbi:hypothetical protein EDB85DRAFT_1895776 [Lactarius pseudohatsudake]|nr:hypothetical protein EDB85DRAFT_1895776 [Lactarius pseudohatsudake]
MSTSRGDLCRETEMEDDGNSNIDQEGIVNSLERPPTSPMAQCAVAIVLDVTPDVDASQSLELNRMHTPSPPPDRPVLHPARPPMLRYSSTTHAVTRQIRGPNSAFTGITQSHARLVCRMAHPHALRGCAHDSWVKQRTEMYCAGARTTRGSYGTPTRIARPHA